MALNSNGSCWFSITSGLPGASDDFAVFAHVHFATTSGIQVLHQFNDQYFVFTNDGDLFLHEVNCGPVPSVRGLIVVKSVGTAMQLWWKPRNSNTWTMLGEDPFGRSTFGAVTFWSTWGDSVWGGAADITLYDQRLYQITIPSNSDFTIEGWKFNPVITTGLTHRQKLDIVANVGTADVGPNPSVTGTPTHKAPSLIISGDSNTEGGPYEPGDSYGWAKTNGLIVALSSLGYIRVDLAIPGETMEGHVAAISTRLGPELAAAELGSIAINHGSTNDSWTRTAADVIGYHETLAEECHKYSVAPIAAGPIDKPNDWPGGSTWSADIRAGIMANTTHYADKWDPGPKGGIYDTTIDPAHIDDWEAFATWGQGKLAAFVAGAPSGPPSSPTLFPLDNATGVGVSAPFTMTFGAETGLSGVPGKYVFVHRTSDNSIARIVHAPDLGFSGGIVTIPATTELEPNTGYYVLVESGAIVRTSDSEAFAGITSSTAWKFTTRVALQYESIGGFAYSAASPAPTFPSNEEGDLLLLFVHQKPSSANSGSVTTPTNWTLEGSLTGAGGYGATLGADTGNTNIYVYSRIVPSGGLSGTLSITTGTNDVACGFFVRFSRASSLYDYSIAVATGSDTSAGSVSVACSTNPGITAGDELIWAFGIPTDVTTPNQFSSHGCTATSATISSPTELGEWDTTTGNDLGGYVARAQCTAGTASAAPTFTATAGGTTTNVRGPGIFVRVRATSVQFGVVPKVDGTLSTLGPEASLSSGLTIDASPANSNADATQPAAVPGAVAVAAAALLVSLAAPSPAAAATYDVSTPSVSASYDAGSASLNLFSFIDADEADVSFDGADGQASPGAVAIEGLAFSVSEAAAEADVTAGATAVEGASLSTQSDAPHASAAPGAVSVDGQALELEVVADGPDVTTGGTSVAASAIYVTSDTTNASAVPGAVSVDGEELGLEADVDGPGASSFASVETEPVDGELDAAEPAASTGSVSVSVLDATADADAASPSASIGGVSVVVPAVDGEEDVDEPSASPFVEVEANPADAEFEAQGPSAAPGSVSASGEPLDALLDAPGHTAMVGGTTVSGSSVTSSADVPSGAVVPGEVVVSASAVGVSSDSPEPVALQHHQVEGEAVDGNEDSPDAEALVGTGSVGALPVEGSAQAPTPTATPGQVEVNALGLSSSESTPEADVVAGNIFVTPAAFSGSAPTLAPSAAPGPVSVEPDAASASAAAPGPIAGAISLVDVPEFQVTESAPDPAALPGPVSVSGLPFEVEVAILLPTASAGQMSVDALPVTGGASFGSCAVDVGSASVIALPVVALLSAPNPGAMYDQEVVGLPLGGLALCTNPVAFQITTELPDRLVARIHAPKMFVRFR